MLTLGNNIRPFLHIHEPALEGNTVKIPRGDWRLKRG